MWVWVFWLMLLLMFAPIATATDGPNTKSGCQEACAGVTVPYPFGINSPNCAINESFVLNCTHTDGGTPQLLLGENKPVKNISLNGTLTVSIEAAYGCYNSGIRVDYANQSINLPPFFTFSDSGNLLTVVGCDTLAMVINNEGTYGAACFSFCTESVNMTDDNPCSGTGCCQSSIAMGLKSLFFEILSVYNHTNVSQFNPCGYTFLAERSSLKLSDWNLSRKPNNYTSDVLLEWVVKTEKCPEGEASVCGNNTECNYSENGEGYRCSCKQGFEGNPYLQGCQDIDECADPQSYPCRGSCHNKVGDYTCSCPFGKYGDGKTGCHGFTIASIAAVIAGSVSPVIIGILLYIICMKRRKYKNFRENGGTLLKTQRVRIFGEAELRKATKNYDDAQKLGEGGFGSVYEGVLEDHTKIAVKKPKRVDKGEMNEDFRQEIFVVSQVNHKNVVKLLGLCLETKVPLLVYEFISNGNLSEHIHDHRSKILTTWKNRLRIAAEVALALDYLHSLADPPIIHGDVKSVNVLLDDRYTAKIADFGASVLISPGQVDIVTKIKGTFGYLDPEYLMTGILTDKSDVYSFGVVLVELLTGEKPNSCVKSGKKRNMVHYFISSLENNRLPQILGFQAADDGEMDEIEEVAKLAKRCVSASGVNRPSMKEVSDKLALLKTIHDNSWTEEHNQETRSLLGDSSPASSKSATTSINQSQSYTVMSSEIESYTATI